MQELQQHLLVKHEVSECVAHAGTDQVVLFLIGDFRLGGAPSFPVKGDSLLMHTEVRELVVVMYVSAGAISSPKPPDVKMQR